MLVGCKPGEGEFFVGAITVEVEGVSFSWGGGRAEWAGSHESGDVWSEVRGVRMGASEDGFVVVVVGLEEANVVRCDSLEELEDYWMVCELMVWVVEFGVVVGEPALAVGCVSNRDSFGYARSDVLFDVSIYVLAIVDEAILGGENGRLRYGVLGRVGCVDGWLWGEVVGKSVIRVDAGVLGADGVGKVVGITGGIVWFRIWDSSFEMACIRELMRVDVNKVVVVGAKDVDAFAPCGG